MQPQVIFSKRRTIGLQIGSKGLFVRVPLKTPMKYINQLLESKKEWIESKMKLLEKKKESKSSEYLNNENTFWLFGEKVIFARCLPELVSGSKIADCELSDSLKNKNFVMKNEGILRFAQNDSSKQQVKLNINDDYKQFYKAQLENYLETKLPFFANLICVNYSIVKVKKLKSKWGSCSSKGVLVFNSDLAKCPADIIDYVIIHELCHRKEMNHSRKFWNLVEQYCPDWKQTKKWFKVYGENVMK